MAGQKREARLRAGRPGHPRLSCGFALKTWMAGTRPGMAKLGGVDGGLLTLLAHRVEAVRAAAGGREEKTGEAEQDRRGSAVEQRMEYRRIDAALEHVSEEIGKGHLAGQDERNRTREQPEHQQRAADQFDGAGGVD